MNNKEKEHKMDYMKLYNTMPVFAQNMMCSLEGFRVKKRKYGRLQKKYLPGYIERGKWTFEELAAYRDEKLREMIEHCYIHVPYYHKLFDEIGIDYHSIHGLDDLQILPIMNKQIVKENLSLLLADNVNKRDVMKMHTSGTTGSALQFYYSKTAYAHQWAEYERYAIQCGHDTPQWAAYFGGRSIVPRTGVQKPPFYRVNYPMKEVLFSAWHISPDNLPGYIEGMEKYRPLWWHGYASSIEAFAQYINDSGKRLSFNPNGIFLSSENVTDSIKKKIYTAFGVIPVEGYAQTEEVATFREYPDDGMYIVEDLSAVELLPDDSGMFRVVGTTLTNYAMPFLRYDTNDLVDYMITEKGRKITRIEGRAEDNIKVKDGGIIRRLDYLFKDQINVADACIIQRSMDIVEFNIVKGARYTEEDESRLKYDIEDFFDGRIGYKITYVDNIPKGKNGKRKFIVSEV